jgi:hypothetical protein
MGHFLRKILTNQKQSETRIKTLEKAVDEIQGKINDVIDVNEFIQNKVSNVGKSVLALEREVVRLDREINDSFIVIAGIPEVDGEIGERGSEKTRELATAVLVEGGFVDLSKKIISAWRPKPKRNQNSSNRIIMVKFESLQARRRIMGCVKNLPSSTLYPNRKFYPRKSPIELQGEFRMRAVMALFTKNGCKVERKWGGFYLEGEEKVYKPLDFLQSAVFIKGQWLDIDKLMSATSTRV